MATEVPWQEVAGFRNLVVHEYLRLDLSFVWEIVTEDLPLLKRAILLLRETLGSPD